VKYVLNNRFYYRVVGDLVFRTSQEFGHIINTKPDDLLPPSEKFYLGGPNNMRGFEYFTLGPKRSRIQLKNKDKPADGPETINEPLGGTVEMYSIFELEYPLIREAGLKAVVFADVGNVFDGFWGGEFRLRSDVGFGVRWFSPIGPLRFEFGYPVPRKGDEKNSVFNFFIGTPF
jgi:outer membrane protein insertion porin family